MANTIDKYLKHYGHNRNQVALASGLSKGTLAAANDKPVSQMTVKVVQALAQVTHQTPGQVLDALFEIEGNPIIVFIQKHPELNRDLVKKIENQLITISWQGGSIKNVTFNRYYDDGKDTPERATQAMKNLSEMLDETIEKHK
ncbi:hypothetical protein IWT25_00683 [Secundilactobacillus pentosiphilus]|uniref:HTH cro/C1-type domain-containing protein n=1 Tax=Secundilactobacillus pentosiphilus TaxID=1714682 RepID=A0A1Z5IUK5_9LACO|nr:hypothetical protein [Secundilactobacillus pentosiphilus]GAX05379.1 hypothetical protein IWT25_00683 [Secundilactobacillus pentosiphilus]